MATTITTKGVLTINGKQVEETFNNLRKLTGSLERDLKKLPVGSEEFVKKSEELNKVSARFNEVKTQINETKKSAQQMNAEAKSVGSTFTDLGGKLQTSFASLLAGEVSFKSLGATIKVFAAQSWAAIGSIPIIGWLAALAAGIGLVAREVLQYNEQLFEANKLTQDITKLQGEQLDKMTIRSQTLEQVLGLDRKETLETAKNLVQNFGISYSKAMDVIEMGAIKGGKANTEFLKSLKEYPVFFANAGYSVEEFAAIVNAGFDLGIYDDKLPDALKEFDLSMREQTKSTREALVNAFGAPFSDDILKRVSQGKTTVKDALVEINQESQKYNLTQKQQAQLTADIFRGAGEDVGGFAKIMEAVTIATSDQNTVLTETQQITKDQIDAYDELGVAKNDALKSDAILAMKREFELLWISVKTGFYNAIASLKIWDREFLASNRYMTGVFSALPKAAGTAFENILNALKEMINGFGSGFKSISLFFKGDFDGAKLEAEKFANTIPSTLAKIKGSYSKLASDINKSGKENANAYRDSYDAQNKAYADAQKIIDKRRADAAKNGNDFDGSEKKNADKKKASDKAAKEAAAQAKKDEAERKKHLEQIIKDEEDANKTLLGLRDDYQKSKTKLIEDAFQKEAQEEADRRNIQERKNLTEIAELEKKKLDTKSLVAKANYQKSIEAIQQIEILNEETHQFNMLTIQQKWDEKMFQAFVESEQRRIDEARRLDEEDINNITTMEEAELALSQMKYLKLTDQELRGIQTLEDAKRALREDADRAMLAAQMESLNQQKIILEQALSGLTGEAAEKLKADLDQLNIKITALKGAINGGSEADSKKVKEESDAAKDAVDIFGFSAKDWEDTFKNLDTTADKLKAAGMVFSALSNAGKDFADLQRSLAEKDMRRFEDIQNKKKTSLLKQLNEGYITQEDYNKEVQKLEAETANKKAELEYKQAKADKIMRMFGIIGNTALAVSSALAAPFPINTTLPWIVGAMGALQLGIAAAQPLPERPSYASGGYTGMGFGSADGSGYKPAGTVHEGEYVTPKWMVESSRYANVLNWLENERTGNAASFASGGMASSSENNSTSSNTLSGGNPASESSAVLSRVGDFLEYLIVNGVIIAKTAKNGKEADEMISDWKNLKNKNKH